MNADPTTDDDLLTVTERLLGGAHHTATLTLPFAERSRSRLRARLDDGREVGLNLPRFGGVLRDGDCLRAVDGTVIRVRAAPEAVTTATATDTHALARACYHLGNRHVPLQIGPGWVRYLQDHVLDTMVNGLGLKRLHEQAPFEPESGAYPGAHHHHG